MLLDVFYLRDQCICTQLASVSTREQCFCGLCTHRTEDRIVTFFATYYRIVTFFVHAFRSKINFQNEAFSKGRTHERSLFLPRPWQSLKYRLEIRENALRIIKSVSFLTQPLPILKFPGRVRSAPADPSN